MLVWPDLMWLFDQLQHIHKTLQVPRTDLWGNQCIFVHDKHKVHPNEYITIRDAPQVICIRWEIDSYKEKEDYILWEINKTPVYWLTAPCSLANLSPSSQRFLLVDQSSLKGEQATENYRGLSKVPKLHWNKDCECLWGNVNGQLGLLMLASKQKGSTVCVGWCSFFWCRLPFNAR